MNMAMNDERIWHWLRVAGWIGAAVLLALPLVAMRFTSEVDWTLSDFVVMGALLAGSGLVLELATRKAPNMLYRLGVTAAVATSFLLVWVNLAVGFLDDEGNPANLMFLGVIGVAASGALVARSAPKAMAAAMAIAAGAQVLAGAIGFVAGWSSPGGQGVYEVVMGTTLFSALWLGSAALFWKAGR